MIDLTRAVSGAFVQVSLDDLRVHGPGLFESVLSFLELQVEHLRAKKRLGRNTTFEGLAPVWLRPILRSDLSKKDGIQNRWDITDADVDRWLASRGIRLQYVWEFQDAAVHPAVVIGGNAVPKRWPGSVQILLYQSGAFQAIQGPSVQLDAVYDRENLQEQARPHVPGGHVGPLSRCGLKYLYDIPLRPNGVSGGTEVIDCSTIDTPPAPAAPTGVATGATTADTAVVDWTWTKGTGGDVTAFEVRYRTPAGSGAWTKFATDAAPADRTLTVTGLEAATEYEFQVTAVGTGGSVVGTPQPTATTAAAAAPQTLMASSGDSSDSGSSCGLRLPGRPARTVTGSGTA